MSAAAGTVRRQEGMVGYVVKRYPRYSETFIVTEILAHERAGLPLEVFSLRPCNDTHFQDIIAAVRSPVTQLPAERIRADDLWKTMRATAAVIPQLWSLLPSAGTENVHDLYQALLLAGEVVRKDIRHLHAHFASSATSVARLAARFAGITYSFTAHAKDIFHESVEPDDLRRKLGDAAAVVTVSDYNRAYLQQEFGSCAAPTRRIYNGLGLAQFPYVEPQERPPRIVAVGRLVEKKGFDVLLDACALLAGHGVVFECEIVGSGELTQHLEARIDALRIRDRVWLAGPQPQREVIRRVQQAAVLAAPCVVGPDSNRDGMPTVVLEAMALGTPCVATDVTGLPELVRHDRTGLAVPQHDAAALAAALQALLSDSVLRVRLAREARALIEGCFDTDGNAALLREVFRDAVRPASSLRVEAGR